MKAVVWRDELDERKRLRVFVESWAKMSHCGLAVTILLLTVLCH